MSPPHPLWDNMQQSHILLTGSMETWFSSYSMTYWFYFSLRHSVLSLSLSPFRPQSVLLVFLHCWRSLGCSLLSHMMTDSTSAPAKFPMPSRHSPLFVNQIVRQQDCLCCTNQTIDHVLVYSETRKLNIDQLQVHSLSSPLSPEVCCHVLVHSQKI